MAPIESFQDQQNASLGANEWLSRGISLGGEYDVGVARPIGTMFPDPRLMEIEWLARLDQAAFVGFEYRKPNPIGGEQQLVHDMLISFARNLHLVTYFTPASTFGRQPDLHPDPMRELKEICTATVEQLDRFQVRLKLTHEGRLRLWRLRAELDAGRIRDKFGILWDDRHWQTDLRIRAWMKTPEEALSIMVADLDHFKAVNDTLGHEEGDRGIKRYRTIVREIVAEDGGEAYAMGGDEAAVILPKTGADRARELAERIRGAVEISFKGFGSDLGKSLANAPTVSIGVRTFAKEIDPESARKEADQLVYQAKQKGRNRVEVA